MNTKIKEHVEALRDIYEARRLGNERLDICIKGLENAKSDLEALIYGIKYSTICRELSEYDVLLKEGELIALKSILEEIKNES